MKTNSSNQLWGIYHANRKYARLKGDPLQTVIEASTREDAEREARRLGFHDAWAHPVVHADIVTAKWLPDSIRKRVIESKVSKLNTIRI